jgi:predicted nucleic acid-binding protein
MSEVALDTSAAVPYVVRSHTAHSVVRGHIGERRVCLTGHSLAETYSVLTRLPGDARVAPSDAVTLLERNFDPACVVDGATARTLHAELAPLGIAGGAVYDALVALAARGAGIALATRDRRAEGTYNALGVQVDLIVG